MQTDEHATVTEEFDLVGVLQSLWSQKWLVLSVAGLVFAVSLIYLFLARPVYESRVYLAPPTQNEIANFNYGRTSEAELSPYTIKDVYDVFLHNLRAESLRRDFFRTVYLPSLSEAERAHPQDELYDDFLKHISLEAVSAETPDRYVFRVHADSVEKAVDWAGAFVRRAGEAGLKEMIDNATREAEVRARSLNQQISTLRENGRKVREDRIVRLREALSVAQAIKLERPPIINDGLSGEISAAMNGDLTYMRGSDALEAEIENLERRSTDDPFLPELRRLQVKHEFFKNLEVVPESVSVYRVDGALGVPDTKVSPRVALILGLGAFAGVALGLIVALSRFFVQVAVRQYGQRRVSR
ncbi:LPS O-antigen chain length determinant protein WzzB [Pseudomonas wadenswilerensis]